jgi:hypothetical protein
MIGDKTSRQQQCPFLPLQVADPVKKLQAEGILCQPFLPAPDKDPLKIVLLKLSTTSSFNDNSDYNCTKVGFQIFVV